MKTMTTAGKDDECHVNAKVCVGNVTIVSNFWLALNVNLVVLTFHISCRSVAHMYDRETREDTLPMYACCTELISSKYGSTQNTLTITQRRKNDPVSQKSRASLAMQFRQTTQCWH